jgi:hypothetical protein
MFVIDSEGVGTDPIEYFPLLPDISIVAPFFVHSTAVIAGDSDVTVALQPIVTVVSDWLGPDTVTIGETEIKYLIIL